MFRKLLLLFAVLVLGMIVIIMVQPSAYRVTRTGVIDASPEVVYAKVNNLRQWNDWSPWASLDPAATYSYDGPESGVGSKITWAGNDDVGQGTMTIIETDPNTRVRTRIDFTAPMNDTGYSTITLKPIADGKTEVSWSMEGENGFIGKALGLVMNFDKMIGDKYEEGLANLNRTLKSPSTAITAQPEPVNQVIPPSSPQSPSSQPTPSVPSKK